MKLLLVVFAVCLLLPGQTVPEIEQHLAVQVNRSTMLDLAGGFKRVSVANNEIAEAVAVSSTELLLNGKTPGETSLFTWDLRGGRHSYSITVAGDESLIATVREELAAEVGPGATLTVQGPSAFLKGTVATLVAAERARVIASAIPRIKVVNLLQVAIPPAEPQILLKVRFADVDRSLSNQFGVNLFGLNDKGLGTSTTGQFGSPPTLGGLAKGATGTLTDLLNIMYYRPDLNLGVVLEDLEARNALQILAEPNLLTMSGHPASFLAGGEFPFPTIQGGANGVGQITIQFKEFGIRLGFLPTITPRGTIHLTVSPEVSSLDYANGLTYAGHTIPALATKRVTTDVELQSGQSFAIAGLLDNQLTETINRMPGFASIPVLGQLFRSRAVSKSHTELLVVVTPELVMPTPVGVASPNVVMPRPFLPGKIPDHLGNGLGPALPAAGTTLPVEELKAMLAAEAAVAQAPGADGITSAGTSPPNAPLVVPQSAGPLIEQPIGGAPK